LPGSHALSPISEHSSEDQSATSSLTVHFSHPNAELHKILSETLVPDIDDWVPKVSHDMLSHCDDEGRLPLSLWAIDPDFLRNSDPIIFDEADLDDEVELWVYHPMTATIPELPDNLNEKSIVVFKTSESNDVRREIIQRDDDLLTPQQIKEHWKDVETAMLKELHTWAKLKCFSRKPRSNAKNIIDTRWVLKFKWDQPTVDVRQSGGRQTEGQPVRTIRARLTVRGFKDSAKQDIDRYAGTSSKCSQKILVSEAVRRGWDICTTDISKAFLQGVTYKELAELTGEPEREVNFYLPAGQIALLRKVPGFESF